MMHGEKKKKAAILNHHSTLPSIFINTSVITSAIVVQTLVNVYNIKKNIEANFNGEFLRTGKVEL